MQDWQNGGFGLYLHWPFCEAKCPYCDFNSHVARFIDQDAWKSAYLREIDRAAETTQDRVLNSVFIGGGTPSLMAPDTVDAVLNRIATHWRIANDFEVTLEANPSSVEAEKFRAFRSAGVNRVSLGVQALNDIDLKKLGRLHSVDEAFNAMDIAQSQFDRCSFDLIYARQDQSLSEWESELKAALTRGFSHFSLYQLTIEDGTAFGDRYNAGKLSGLPTDDLAADMYQLTLDICEDAGLPYYEVSNFAEPAEQSRHNLVYWRYGDYIGIGPGAHGRLTDSAGYKYATEATANPRLWLDAANGPYETQQRSVLSAEEQAQEYLLMNIRLREGVAIDRFRTFGSTRLNADALTALQEEGAVSLTDDVLRVLPDAVPLTNAILTRLLSD